MGYDDKGTSGIVSVVSRQAGTIAGTSVVIGKKIAGCGVKTVIVAKDWLKQPLKTLMPARDKKSWATSEASVLESRDEQETGRKKAAKALIAVLESDLASAQRELKKVQNNAEKTQSKLASQLGELKVEKESLNSAQHHLEKLRKEEQGVKSQPPSDLSNVRPEEKTGLSDRAEEKVEAVLTEEKVESVMEPTVAVADEEAQAAVFPNATDKIIFMRALSDIASEHVAARADAARAMGGIDHGLSVRVLVAQMEREPSPQVRQECIKALTTLGKEEGLPVIESALTDESTSVRLAGVRGLYHVAGAEGAPALARMFSDESEGVRRRAASCVGWLGQEELAVELLPLLTDSSVSVRRAAAEAMGNLRSRQVVSALIECLNDPEKSVRKAVLGAIETITGKKMKEPSPPNEKSLQRLIARWRQWWKEELLG